MGPSCCVTLSLSGPQFPQLDSEDLNQPGSRIETIPRGCHSLPFLKVLPPRHRRRLPTGPRPACPWGPPQFLYSPTLLEVLPREAALTVLARGLKDSSPEVRVLSLQGLANILFHPEKVRARGASELAHACAHHTHTRTAKASWAAFLALSLPALWLGTRDFTSRSLGVLTCAPRMVAAPGRVVGGVQCLLPGDLHLPRPEETVLLQVTGA